MKKDYFDELGEVALGSRLKRLSDRLMNDASKIYKDLDLEIQPKWFTLLSLLYEQKTVSVVEASLQLGLSQPCISQFAKELKEKGYVKSVSGKKDKRKRELSLTAKGGNKYKAMLPVRTAVDNAVKSLCKELEQNFFLGIKQFEKAINDKSLYQRTMEKYYEKENN